MASRLTCDCWHRAAVHPTDAGERDPNRRFYVSGESAAGILVVTPPNAAVMSSNLDITGSSVFLNFKNPLMCHMDFLFETFMCAMPTSTPKR